jgi:hypothetical protein
MFIQVTDAVDGEQFLLNTAFVRAIHPMYSDHLQRPARSVVLFKDKDEDAIPLTESVSTIACLLHGELPPVDIEGLRQKIEAAI